MTSLVQKLIRHATLIARYGPVNWLATRRADTAGDIIQKTGELAGLVRELRPLRVVRILEIGVAGGGSLALWCETSAIGANLIGIDPNISAEAETRIRARLRPEQQLRLLRFRSEDALKRVRELLAGEFLDFLFIDGDHGYENVAADFKLYGPLVRSGGLVAFHDNCPDSSSRQGQNYSGQVPRFWNEIKGGYRNLELIEEPGQDGFGIGVLWMD